MRANISCEKVDLCQALQLVASDADLKYKEYVSWFSDHFRCGERAAKDSLAILADAGYLDRRRDDRDRRVRRYTVSARGQLVLSMPGGPAVLRFARGLFSTCVRPDHVAKRKGVSAARERLERAESYLLGPTPSFELAPEPPSYVSPLPPPTLDPGQPVEQPLIHQPRCKVCRSDYRAEIDLSLAAGLSQAEVRREFNSRSGRDSFTANNISRHARNHVNEHDPRLRELLQARVDRAAQAKKLHYQQLSAVVNTGLRALRAGLTEVPPRDLIRAVEQLDQLACRSAADEIAEMVREFEAFVEAVQEVGGDQKYERILANYQERWAKARDFAAYSERRWLLEPRFPYS